MTGELSRPEHASGRKAATRGSTTLRGDDGTTGVRIFAGCRPRTWGARLPRAFKSCPACRGQRRGPSWASTEHEEDSAMGDTMEMAAKFEEVMKAGDFGRLAELVQQYATDDFVEEW